MAKRRQLEFTDRAFLRPELAFGGSLLKGNPKGRRPLDSKLPIHVVLRAKKGLLRLPKSFGAVQNAISIASKRRGVKIYRQANVGNHLHLVIRISHRRQWAAFIRALSGHIALAVRTTLRLDSIVGFWLHRPFTRVIPGWRRAFTQICDYVELNNLEAEGHINRAETKSLTQLRELFSTA